MKSVRTVQLMSVGNIRYRVVSDGAAGYPLETVFPDLSKEDKRALGDSLADDGVLITPYSCGLVQLQDH
jgi:hypothetical protein